MRPDFAYSYNVTSRRPRDIEDYVKGGRPPRDLDDLPHFEGMADARRRGWDRKERTHKFSILKRWLRSQIGRRWNDVYSDIARISDHRSGSTRSLREHVHWFVELDTYVDEHGIVRDSQTGYEVNGLYVDADGVLRYIERPKFRYRKPVNHDVVVIDRHRELQRIEGLWYEVLYADLDEPKRCERVRPDGSIEVYWTSPGAYDIVLKASVFRHAGLRWGRSATRYAYAKRALSRKELRRYGLVNDPDAKDAARRRKRRRWQASARVP